MAIFVPHQTNRATRNANPVQTAQYRSPSAFMTGQENLGQGLQQLAGGAEKLNDVLFNGTVEERMERLELSAKSYCQNRKLEVASASEELQTQFTGEKAQGLVEKMHELQTSKLQEMHDMFGHNPKVLKHVVDQCGSIYTNSIANMRAYEKQQQKVYRTGVTHTEIGLASQVWMDPDSTPEQREKALSSAATMVLYNTKADGLPEEYAKQQNDALRRNFTSERMKMEIDAKLEAGDIEGARATLLNVENGNVDVMETASNFAAQFESGSEGITAIGYDKNGGTSYGKHQISSSTMGAFITYLDEKAPHIAAQLKEAGPVNTGGTTGKMPDTWKKIAAEEPELFEKLQYDFIVKTHVNPAVNKLPAQLQRLFASDPAIASAVFSTAVQHGEPNKPTSASNLIKQAWENSGGSRPAFITNLYAARATCFPSSTEENQKKAAARFERERDMLLNMLQPALLSPSDRMALEKRIESQKNYLSREVQSIVKTQAPNAFTWQLRTGDSSTIDALEEQLVSYGKSGATALKEFRQERAVYHALQPYWAGVAKESFLQQGESLKAWFDEHTTPDNAAKMAEYEQKAMTAYQQNFSKFLADPFTHATTLQTGPFTNEGSKIQDNIEKQQFYAEGVPGFTPKVMPTAQAQHIKASYTLEQDWQKKADTVYAILGQYGQYAPQALAEAGLPLVTQLVPMLDRGTATRLVIASETKPENIPGTDTVSIKNAKITAVTSSLYRASVSLANHFKDSKEQASFANSLKDTLTSYAAHGWDISELEKQFTIINDSGLAVIAPAGINTDALENATRTKRQQMLTEINALRFPKEEGAPALTLPEMTTLFAYENAYRTGTWAYDGSGFTLIDKSLGRIAASPSGEPVRVTMQDIHEAAQKPVYYFYENNVMP